MALFRKQTLTPDALAHQLVAEALEVFDAAQITLSYAVDVFDGIALDCENEINDLIEKQNKATADAGRAALIAKRFEALVS